MKSPVAGCFAKQLLDAISVACYLVKIHLECLGGFFAQVWNRCFQQGYASIIVATPNQTKDHSS